MKSIFVRSLLIVGLMVYLHADVASPSTPSFSEPETSSLQLPNTPAKNDLQAMVPTKSGFFAPLAQITFKKAFAVIAAAGIISAGLYKLYAYVTTSSEQDDNDAPLDKYETLALTDVQRRIIDDFAAAIDACDVVAISKFDFEEFPIDIMLLLHWARMDILAAQEQEKDQEVMRNHRHSIATALRGLAHPDEIIMDAAEKHPLQECA